jgi:hypothetical protein
VLRPSLVRRQTDDLRQQQGQQHQQVSVAVEEGIHGVCSRD